WGSYNSIFGGYFNGTSASPTTLFFPASGYRNYNTGSVDYATTNGYYWSSSVYNADNGRNLNFNSSNVNPENNNNRSNGFPVRCVQ
ncbi:MAG: hypothetical protein RR752_00260, partial [Mucinivorans sp.]